MKPSTTLIFAGIALLFLAMLCSFAPTLMLFFQRAVNISFWPGVFLEPPGIFVWNYFICGILGIVFLLSGFWKLWNEK